MAYRWLTDLDAALAAGGVPFVEVPHSPIDPTGAPSWRERGRPASTGSYDPAGILCHHTASPAGTSTASDLNVILCGNSEAPGPISALYVPRSGDVVHLVAAGRANHGGKGRRPGIDGGGCADMNAALLGIEAANAGNGHEVWSDAMCDLYGATVAALCDWYGWDVRSQVYLHATTGPPNGGCNSKIDPAGPWTRQPHLTGTWDLDTWRDFCASTAAPPRPPEADDMTISFLTVSDGAQPLDAVFIGYVQPGPYALQIQWATEAIANRWRAVNTPTVAVSLDQVRSMTLLGPVPVGDRYHGWGPGDFAAVIT